MQPILLIWPLYFTGINSPEQRGKPRNNFMKSSYLFILFLYLLLPTAESCLYAQHAYGVKEVKFKGNHSFPSGKLEKLIETHGISSFNKNILRKKPIKFNEEIVEGDLQRLISYYQQEGFLFVKISKPLLEIDEKSRLVKMTIPIEEGEPILVSNVLFDTEGGNNANIVEVNQISGNVMRSLELTKGKRFRDQSFKNDQQKILLAFNNSGYPYVEVHPVIRVDQPRRKADIIWRIHSGLKCRFGKIIIDGNERIPADYILKHLTFKEGQTYRQEAIEKSQQRLFALGLFRVATLRAILTPEKNDDIPIVVRIHETSRLTSRIGAGYGYEDKFRVFTDARYLSFLGTSRRLNVLLKHSGLEPINLDLKWIDPVFFTPKTALTVNPFIRRQTEPGYTVNRRGIRLSALHQISQSLRGSITYIFERVNQDTTGTLTSDIDQDDLYNKSGPLLGLTIDTSNPFFNPNSGMFIALTLKVNGILLAEDFSYAKILLDVRRYQQMGKIILAYRGKIGNIKSYDANGFIPVEERFYAGGSTSVRGWGRQQLGPLDTNGKPSGGNSLLEGSVEARFPIINRFIGAVFLDFGNVWVPSATYKLNEIRYSVGMGAGINTPIGPLRLDIARPIFDVKKTVQFNFNIGHAF